MNWSPAVPSTLCQETDNLSVLNEGSDSWHNWEGINSTPGYHMTNTPLITVLACCGILSSLDSILLPNIIFVSLVLIVFSLVSTVVAVVAIRVSKDS